MKRRPKIDLDSIDYMQRYLSVEMFEMYREGRLSRRGMLRKVIGICGSGAAAAALIASCEDDKGGSSAGGGSGGGGGSGRDASAGAGASGGAGGSASAAGGSGGADAAVDAGARDGAAATDASPPGVLSVPANDPAVEGMDIRYMGDVELRGYFAKPKNAMGTLAGVVVIHENRGLTDHIRDVARRLAKAGFMALSVDLASRGGGTEMVGGGIQAFLSDMNRRPDLIKDIGFSLDELGRRGALKDKYGVTGFCYGGGMTWQAAANHARVLAAVPYYGPMPPLELLKTTNAAILAHYAQNDNNVNGANNATIDATQMTLKDAGKVFEKMIHPGTGHAFNNDTGASYNETAAVNAWMATLDWFRKYLK